MRPFIVCMNSSKLHSESVITIEAYLSTCIVFLLGSFSLLEDSKKMPFWLLSRLEESS